MAALARGSRVSLAPGSLSVWKTGPTGGAHFSFCWPRGQEKISALLQSQGIVVILAVRLDTWLYMDVN